jgi:Tropomyosin like
VYRLLTIFVVPHLHRYGRLRQVDVKAEHFERQLQRVEQERDEWEKKFEVCVMVLTALLADCLCRKCRASTASRKRNWTNWLQTWRGSNILTTFYPFITTTWPLRVSMTHVSYITIVDSRVMNKKGRRVTPRVRVGNVLPILLVPFSGQCY